MSLLPLKSHKNMKRVITISISITAGMLWAIMILSLSILVINNFNILIWRVEILFLMIPISSLLGLFFTKYIYNTIS